MPAATRAEHSHPGEPRCLPKRTNPPHFPYALMAFISGWTVRPFILILKWPGRCPAQGGVPARGIPVPTRSGVTFQGRCSPAKAPCRNSWRTFAWGEWPDLLVAPFAAVMSGIPALLARRISELAVHVLGSTVSPARQRSRSESHHAHEAPDCQDHCGEEEDSLPPRHLGHHDPIWTTDDCPTQQGRMKPGDAPGTGPQQHADPGDADEWPDP